MITATGRCFDRLPSNGDHRRLFSFGRRWSVWCGEVIKARIATAPASAITRKSDLGQGSREHRLAWTPSDPRSGVRPRGRGDYGTARRDAGGIHHSGHGHATNTGKTGVATWRHRPLAERGTRWRFARPIRSRFRFEARRPAYRDRWESDDEAIIQAFTAERERLIAAARESAAPYRRGKGRVPREADPPASPAGRIEDEPVEAPQWGSSGGSRAGKTNAAETQGTRIPRNRRKPK